MSKMYILIRDDVEAGFAVLAAAHASLACYLKFQEEPSMVDWVSGVFRKAVCKVNDKEFQAAKAFEKSVVLTESALGGREVAIAFCPREEWPKPFQFYRLWK
jgi:peptidyl-tRNA hydrolase